METKTFEIEYRLKLVDDTFLETKTVIAAINESTAVAKLKVYRSKNPGFTSIEIFTIKRLRDIII